MRLKQRILQASTTREVESTLPMVQMLTLQAAQPLPHPCTLSWVEEAVQAAEPTEPTQLPLTVLTTMRTRRTNHTTAT